MDEDLYSAKILIVDDEESIRQTLEIFLNGEGYQAVKTVTTFDAALEALSQAEYDLIISDIVLMGRSGTDLLQKIRESGTKCPVVMITGFPNLDSAAKSIRHGAFDYISKPVNKETLLHFTRRALQHWFAVNKAQRLKQENEKYRRYLDTIFRSVSDAIITVDSQLRVVQLNEKAKQWLNQVFQKDFQMGEETLIRFDSNGKVQQWIQSAINQPPVYKTIGTVGTPQETQFIVAAFVGDHEIARATAKSKCEASKKVAAKILDMIESSELTKEKMIRGTERF